MKSSDMVLLLVPKPGCDPVCPQTVGQPARGTWGFCTILSDAVFNSTFSLFHFTGLNVVYIHYVVLIVF